MQVFVFAARSSDRLAARNRLLTLENPINLDRLVERGLDKRREGELRQLRDRLGGLWAWGTEPHRRGLAAWRLMEPGDFLLSVVSAQYTHIARIARRVRGEDPQLARLLWPDGFGDPQHRTAGRVFSLVYFLERPQSIAPAVAVSDVSDQLATKYWGLTHIGFKQKLHIGVDAFMTQTFGYRAPHGGV